jgi:hypothetical protein
MSDEHHRPLDAADGIGDRVGVGREPAQRVGDGDHRMTGLPERVDDAVPARRLGEGTMDEHDRGAHEAFLSVVASSRTGQAPGL